jgi:kynureninase
VVTQEWGRDLIRDWNTAGWFTLPQRLGKQIAPLIGAGADQVVATKTTSVNLYKVPSAAISICQQDTPQRRVLVSERSNFPTDLYIAEGLCQQHELTLKLVEPEALSNALDSDLATLMLTHVNYRTGAMPVNLMDASADFAVGCSYKYLNGGPGAPAFFWVTQHADRFWQPLSG